MPRYTTEFKEQVVRKLMPPNAQTVAHVSRETGVSEPTLYNWRSEYRAKGYVVPADDSNPEKWNGDSKLAVLIETAAMNEAEVSEYCRSKGLYPDQIAQWKEAAVVGVSEAAPMSRSERKQAAKDRKKIRRLEKDLNRKDIALAEAAALLVLQKKAQEIWGGARGRLTSIEDRRTSVELIHEAERKGARRSRACPVLDISVRTLQRWEQGLVDQRKSAAVNRNPGNKLGEDERERVLNVVNQPEFASLPPSRIVPALADQGEYLCSERTIYRILSEARQNNERGRAQRATQLARPAPLQATAPNEVWSWDITYLRSAVKGQFFYLYLIMDIYSRKIVGWEVHEEESAEHASMLVSKACLAEGVHRAGLAPHSDNGSPMKGATMLGTLQRLGVVPSFSRPSVSNDNPYSESLFRTPKYVPNYPRKPFAALQEARAWVLDFVRWYSQSHLHSAIKFVTPAQKHCGKDIELLKNRAQVYEAA